MRVVVARALSLTLSCVACISGCTLPAGDPCCESDLDCQDGARCFEARCAIACDDDSQCAEGETCVAAAGACARPVRVGESDGNGDTSLACPNQPPEGA